MTTLIDLEPYCLRLADKPSNSVKGEEVRDLSASYHPTGINVSNSCTLPARNKPSVCHGPPSSDCARQQQPKLGHGRTRAPSPLTPHKRTANDCHAADSSAKLLAKHDSNLKSPHSPDSSRSPTKRLRPNSPLRRGNPAHPRYHPINPKIPDNPDSRPTAKSSPLEEVICLTDDDGPSENVLIGDEGEMNLEDRNEPNNPNSPNSPNNSNDPDKWSKSANCNSRLSRSLCEKLSWAVPEVFAPFISILTTLIFEEL